MAVLQSLSATALQFWNKGGVMSAFYVAGSSYDRLPENIWIVRTNEKL